MPIDARCPECRSEFELPDRLAGKQVRCKSCGEVFLVPEADDDSSSRRGGSRGAAIRIGRSRDDDERPARTSRRRDDEDDDEVMDVTRAGGNRLPWILGGVGGGVGVLLLIVLIVFLATRPSEPVVAKGDGPDNGQKDTPKDASKDAGKNIPKKDNRPKDLPKDNRPKDAGKKDGTRPNPDPGPKPPEPSVPWAVTADAQAQPIEIDEKVQGFIGLPGFSGTAEFPSAPSPFAVVTCRPQGATRDARQIWDLRTLKKVGEIDPGKRSGISDFVISPDGKYFAAPAAPGGQGQAVEVWSVATGKSINTIKYEDKFNRARLIDFVGPDELLTAKHPGGKYVFQVWDVKAGKELRTFEVDTYSDPKQWGFSAGHKYLALFPKKGDRAVVYDLTTGKVAGEALLPGGDSPQAKGLCFSPDGKTLAGLFSPPGGGDRIITWDVTAGGKVKRDHKFAKDFQNLAGGHGYKGPPLEWLPDGSGWLAYGQLLIDADSAGLFWKLPPDKLHGQPRRMLTPGKVAMVKVDDKNNRALVVESLPAAEVAAARQGAKAGQDPEASKLPALKQADWTAVREVGGGSGIPTWKVEADPAPAPKGKLGAQPIPLKGKGGDVVRVLFARPDVGQAAVLTAAANNELSTRKQVRVDRYDLADGKHLGGMDLFAFEPPKDRAINVRADLSPDGTMLLVVDPHRQDRVDVWSLADGKHVAGWQPGQQPDGQAQWAAFVDNGRVLTQTAGTQPRLVLWDVAGCKAVYSGKGYRDTPALSPGHKYVAAFNGTTYEVLDAASGERVGQLGGQPPRNIIGAAFRPDGKQLAAVGQTLGGQMLLRWDLAKGEAAGDVLLPMVQDGEMEWCGTDQVLFSRVLIDFKLKCPLYHYNLPGAGRDGTNGPDGRHWFAAARTGTEQAMLTAQTLPDANAKQLAQSLATGAIQPTIGPGMTIKVLVEGGPAADPDGFRKRVIDGLTQHLQRVGFKVGENGPLTLIVRYGSELDTGKKTIYRDIGGGGGGTREVSITKVACSATMTNELGTVWSQKNEIESRLPSGLTNMKEIDRAVAEGPWTACAGWGGSLYIPPYAIRTGKGVENLPIFATLTGDR